MIGKTYSNEAFIPFNHTMKSTCTFKQLDNQANQALIGFNHSTTKISNSIQNEHISFTFIQEHILHAREPLNHTSHTLTQADN